MRTALLPNGNFIHADQYMESAHGFNILCMDKSCRAPVIFVAKSEKAAAHFKTIGKNSDSKHSETCGFFQPLDIVESIEKVAEYQEEILESTSIKKTLISLNMKRLDPEYEAKKTDNVKGLLEVSE